MTPVPPSPAEQLSALLDHAQPQSEIDSVLLACASDAQMHARWRDYQLIGDVLRGQAAGQADELAFVARLRPGISLASTPVHRVEAAANAPHFAWPWLAAAASLVLALGVFWTLAGMLGNVPELAWRQSPVVVSSPQGVIVRDEALEELLEAHRELAGASVLPMPSGFLRNATFDAAPTPLVRPGSAR